MLTFRLHELLWLMDHHADRLLLDRCGIDYATFHPLAVLLDIEPATQHELASHLRQTDAAVSRRIGAFVDAGLLQVRVSPAHGRRNEVTVTDKGRRLATECARVLEEAFSAAIEASGIDVARFESATADLIGILQNDKAPAKGPSRP